MDAKFSYQSLDWPKLLEQVQTEFSRLPAAEQAWIKERLQAIAECQVALDQLFQALHGGEVCRDCHGACCGSGRHYLTLPNLLAALLAGDPLPAPDFSQSCPFLGDSGCLLKVAHRPYNCITFFCEQLDDCLTGEQRQQLMETDRVLRAEYQAFAERYPMAGLRGLWLSLERFGQGSIFRSQDKPMVE